MTWEDGVHLGMKGSTGETIVGDERGVWVTRAVRMKPEAESWDRKSLDNIVDIPWSLGKPLSGAEAIGEFKADVTAMGKDYRETIRQEEMVPRRVAITRSDLETYGYTVKCPGCVALLKGTARQAHSAEC